MNKICTKCGQTKLLTEFYRHRDTKDGRNSYCKICQNFIVKTYMQTPVGREARKRSNKKYNQTPTGNAVHRKLSRAHRRKYPQRIRARSAVGSAIRSGYIPLAHKLTCTDCGNPAQEYDHHLGYAESHKLDVVAVCVPCHHKRRIREY